MTTQSTQSRSFNPSFDSRLLGWGAVGIVALIVAAFISLATPQFTANAAPDHPDYDGAGSSRWPMS